MKKALLSIVFVLLLALPAASRTVNPPLRNAAPEEEVRGAWIATVVGLDWPDSTFVPISQQLKLIEQIRGLADMGCNTVYFQVVSNMDALYPSGILPWSQVLTGEEGQNPGYDPLELAVKAAHECGMKIHAWINPLRVSRDLADKHCPEHVSKKHPQWVQRYGRTLYLDPGIPDAMKYLSDIAAEIMSRYDVDGLHIDDYFYPDGLQKNQRTWKLDSWKKYGKGKKLDDWRYATVNKVVKMLSDITHSQKPGAQFGVSPSGRLVNTLRLYADPRMWVAEGSVDYLVPQIYWAIDRPDKAAFDVVLDSWKDIARGVPVYAGIAAYKHDDAYNKGLDVPFSSLGEFSRQLELCRNASWVKGHVWFRTKYILEDDFKAYILSELY